MWSASVYAYSPETAGHSYYNLENKSLKDNVHILSGDSAQLNPHRFSHAAGNTAHLCRHKTKIHTQRIHSFRPYGQLIPFPECLTPCPVAAAVFPLHRPDSMPERSPATGSIPCRAAAEILFHRTWDSPLFINLSHVETNFHREPLLPFPFLLLSF